MREGQLPSSAWPEKLGSDAKVAGKERQNLSYLEESAGGVSRWAEEPNEGSYLQSEKRPVFFEAVEGGDKPEDQGGKRKKPKICRKKEERPSCVFGVDIHIDRVLEASETLLVGRIGGRKFMVAFIKKWALAAWKEAPGQPEEVKILDRGWFCLRFGKKEHVEWVLSKHWSLGKRPVLFRKWTPLFDAQKEKSEEFPVWVKLMGLPIHLWTDSVFSSIGNTLGKYLEADKSYLHSHDWSAAHLMVILNPKEGLAGDILLKYRGQEFIQTLDYENLLFRCHRCKVYGHLARDCPHGHRRRRRQRKNGYKTEVKDQMKITAQKEEVQPMEAEALANI